MRCFSSFSFVVLAGVLLAVPALGADILQQSGKWSAHSFKEGGSNVCFAASEPSSSNGAKGKKRGRAYVMITHRPAENSRNVFSFNAGYPYKKGAEVKVSVDGQAFYLIGQNETAWTPDDATDQKLVAAIKTGKTLVVEGASVKGTKTKDNFSLTGSGEALAAIDRNCP